jgi:SAM-dependent methyltransferase
MILSDIVNHKNLLDGLESDSATNAVLHKLDAILKYAQDSDEPEILESMTSTRNKVAKKLDQFESTLKQLQQSVLEKIKQKEPEYFAASSSLYNHEMKHDSADHIAQRQLNVDSITALFLQQRLKRYTSWQHPGMVIRPLHALHVDDLVACDPMYFVDTHPDLLDKVKYQFTKEYQSRLCYYHIREYTNQNIFWNLPAQQFGLIYAFHYFNFKPMEIIRDYLSEIYTLLRPSGIFAFTFNNCDFGGAVRLAEHHFCCYTPGRLIKEHALSVGFAVDFEFNDEAGTSWLELRKPGMFATIRGGQNVAAITPREDVRKESIVETIPPTKVDIPTNPLYNQVDMLLDISRMLEIDVTDATAKGAYSVKKLRRLISARLNSPHFPEEKIQRLLNKRNNI